MERRQIWVNTERKELTYVQCMNCGHIYTVDHTIPIKKTIVDLECPRCEWGRALNCGYNDLDVYELKDYFLDERYY